MTQSSPTLLVSGQALMLLRELNDSFQQGILTDVNDISIKINDILTSFEQGAGRPMLEWERFIDSEPPRSQKMNRVWAAASSDISLLQQQIDLLRAAAVSTFNVVNVGIYRAQNENARLTNKLKTLQLYSDNVDSSIITFGDNFASSDFFDQTFSAAQDTPQVINGQYLILAQDGSLINLTNNARITIQDSSNGFVGNNQEIDLTIPEPSNAPEPMFTFVAETYPANVLASITDDSPDSWFEYEQYRVSAANRKSALNFNFKYLDDRISKEEVLTLDWASGPKDDVLKLDINFDLQDIKKINRITYLPYGMRENKNFPVKVSLVEISTDGSTWTALEPRDVWIGTDVNLQTARAAANITTSGLWTFEQQLARYVRLHVEQSYAMNVPIGHLWYTKLVNNKVTRVEGPNPPISNPALYYDKSTLTSKSLTQHRERFNGQRWSIGIRDFLVQQVQYVESSIMVTKPLRVGGVVDRVSLEAEIFVPSTWDTDVSWVSFFISPDDGLNWFPISRIQDDFLGIPEIIAFNDPTPTEFRETGVSYQDVSSTVDTLRLRIDMKRPSDDSTSTPIVHSYKLKVKRR